MSEKSGTCCKPARSRLRLRGRGVLPLPPTATESKAVPASDKRVKAWRFSDTGETGTDVGFTTDDSYDLVSLVGESDAPRGSKDTKGVAPGSSATASEDADADGAMPGSQPGSLPMSSEAEAAEEDEDFYMVQESPVASPRWTADDFVRLQGVVQDLGELNRQLMAFTASQNEEVAVIDEVDEDEVAVIDEVDDDEAAVIDEVPQHVKEEVDYGGATDVEGFEPKVDPDKAEDANIEEEAEQHPPTSCLS
eukprot:s2100_g3.t1